MSLCNQTGRIHSTESFGTVDGPGVRFVVFFQGCPMRCQYCHNPDTWEAHGGTEMTVQELLDQYENNRSFYKNGGMTATGGEPMLQLPFLTKLFKEAKKRGIQTCLDTSGITYRKEKEQEFAELFAYTDLVMLDIKSSDPKLHKSLTHCEITPVAAFMESLDRHNVPIRIRHVIVPGLTYDDEKLFHLGQFIGKLRNLKELEVLPYHAMGVKKYEALNLLYPLEGVKPLTKENAMEARKQILAGVKAVRHA